MSGTRDRMPVAAPVRVTIERGFPAEIDEVAERAAASRRFLRAGWYAAGATEGRTILGRSRDGRPFAALPMVAATRLPGIGRAVAGGYWPLRAPVVARDASAAMMLAMVADPAFVSALGPVWRIGPVHGDDPAALALIAAAEATGWTILTRPLGRLFRLDLTTGDWPRGSTLKRMRGYQRQLGARGTIAFRTVRGADWSDAALADLADVEARSWLGVPAKGHDPKFVDPARRAAWAVALRDPQIADALSATLLTLDGRAVAFSFDLTAGDVQFAIASSYDAGFARCRPGKIVTYRQFADAAAMGVRTICLGIGDSGYKQEIGARAGPVINDYLIVRHRPIAALLRRRWEAGAGT